MADTKVEALQAYCVKCRTKRDIGSAEPAYTKTGTPGTRGQCSECGTKLFRMGATAAHEGIPKPDKIEQPKRKKIKPKSGAKAKSGAKHKAATKANRKRGNVGKLVIVESPKKIKSVGGILGHGYTIMSSVGHVRDLLKSRLSVDIEREFEPQYRVPNDKRSIVKELKAAAESAEEIFLATDPDREGEAMAWHLVAAAEMPRDRIKRVIFHEITKDVVTDAFANPREIDMDLVNAQQARRILDRLVGYNTTELLWEKVRGGLTAGRVQSIALRLVAEREKEVEAFVPVEYWTVDALLRKSNLKSKANEIQARLIKINGTGLARNSKDLKKSKIIALSKQEDIQPHLEILAQSIFVVQTIKRGIRRELPGPPFTTSTLLRTAEKTLGFRLNRTRRIAQQLYEGIDIGQGESVGFITYPRTDSVNISTQTVGEIRSYIENTFGNTYRPKTTRIHKSKEKGAQEAHEAIRPTDILRTPESMEPHLSRDQFRLYELIWQRTVASHMSSAVYDTIRLDISAGISQDDLPYLLRATGSKLKFDGYLVLKQRNEAETENDKETVFPELESKELLDLRRMLPEQHYTKPPPRYTEGALTENLTKLGIGRPATRASIVALIQSPDRDYIKREGQRLIPTATGTLVSDLLSKYFQVEMDYAFTAKMEDQLDEVSEGKLDWRPMLDEFYQPFEHRLKKAHAEMPKQDIVESVGRICPECGENELVIRYSRWGKKYIGCANYPDCRHTESMTKRTPTGRNCPECSDGKLDVLELEGRRGKFIACSNYPECRHTEPFGTGHLCPQCGDDSQGEIVERRTRKGRVFFGCSRYPDCDYTTWKLPKTLKPVEASQLGQDDKEPAVV